MNPLDTITILSFIGILFTLSNMLIDRIGEEDDAWMNWDEFRERMKKEKDEEDDIRSDDNTH